jgi:hypothetical protein
MGEALHLNLSGPYNRPAVHYRDRITPGSCPYSLDGDYRFSRSNPTISVA